MPNIDLLPESEMSEVDYLNREISEARAALSKTVAGLKSVCAASVDPREWIIRYPWAAMGIATLAGFTAAKVVTPAPGVSISDKWSELHSKFCANSSPNADRSVGYSHAQRGSFAATILASLFDLTKLLVESLIIAALRNPTSSQGEATTQPESVEASDSQ
jgi:hypothetical protein